MNITFGGAATWNAINQIVASVEYSNVVNEETFGFIVPSTVKARWKVISQIAEWPAFLLQADKKGREVGGNYPGFMTNLMNTNVAGQVVFGRWSDLVVGTFGDLDLLLDPFSYADE